MQVSIEWKHIRHIDFQSGDKHRIVKDVNSVLEEYLDYLNGKCDHRPDEVRLLTDKQRDPRSDTFCIYCDQPIEQERVIYRLKCPLPLPPRSA